MLNVIRLIIVLLVFGLCVPVSGLAKEGTASGEASNTHKPAATASSQSATQQDVAAPAETPATEKHHPAGDGKLDASYWWPVLVLFIPLVFRLFVAWSAKNQSYYTHLSKIWYDLKQKTVEHPDWADPDITTLYGIRRLNDVTRKPKPYDGYAWQCWAFAEDCYTTYYKGRHTWLYRLFSFFIRSYELEQFMGPIRDIYEMHWAWLKIPDHAGRFDADFREWVARVCEKERVETFEEGAQHGTGVRARVNLEPGNFIGAMAGTFTRSRGTDTVQIGAFEHVKIETKMRNLNHSATPNAFVRGLNVIALNKINKGEEITIDYNATELEIQEAFESSENKEMVQGYKFLSDEQKASIEMRVHRWIREQIRVHTPPD